MKYNYKTFIRIITLLCFSLLFGLPTSSSAQKQFKNNTWQLVNENAGWEKRAGLQVVRLNNNLYVLGGRTPNDSPIPGDSKIWGDVWKSNLSGKSWEEILSTNDNVYWPARAYFSAVTKGNYMYVLGGQNFTLIPNPNPFPAPGEPAFFSSSQFFNDVWRSKDGITWEQMTENAPWEGRAGLSAVVFKNEIYVLGGSTNDDAAVIGGPPERIYYNDVWKSKDGKNWKEVCGSAPWEARAGMRVVVKNGYLYMMGGESGFVPTDGQAPPYYNDVWRSKDGKHWEKVLEAAPWSARPGHEVLVYQNNFVLFGGFNLDPDFNIDPESGPISAKPANPEDVWISKDGKNWKQTTGEPWNAEGPEDVKYDFHAVVVPGTKKHALPAIITVGGDRETFDFSDLENWKNVDNDVWRFYPETNYMPEAEEKEAYAVKVFKKAYPNPFKQDCSFEYDIPEEGFVSVKIYDLNSNLVKILCTQIKPEGMLYLNWDGQDERGRKVKEGMYYVKMIYNDKSEVNMIVKK